MAAPQLSGINPSWVETIDLEVLATNGAIEHWIVDIYANLVNTLHSMN